LCNSGHAGQNTTVDSDWIADGSYLRANLIQFSYNIPAATCKSIGISNLRLYTNVNNAFMICSSKFNGYDPESTSQGDSSKFGQNMTFFAYPRALTWTLGVNVAFCIAYIYFLLLFDILKLHLMRIAMWVKSSHQPGMSR
jgi:hypothetical protein